MARSKTISIFLKDSDPNGIKIAELSVSTAKIYIIPRDKLSFATPRTDLAHPNIYMLFDDERTSVYIGESEDFVNRIKNHVVHKDFWQWALIVVSSDKSLDKADVRFLESLAVRRAIEIGRMEVQNKISPTPNNLHEFKQETMLEFFDDVKLLVSSLGFNIFEHLKPMNARTDSKKRATKQFASGKAQEREYDTIVCPANPIAVTKTFRQQKSWYAVRVGQSNLDKLKHVAIYEKAPISCIRYYAKITKIKPFHDKPGKYTIHHDGENH